MKKHTDIKSVEDACNFLKLDANSIIPDLTCLPKKYRKAIKSNIELIIVVEAVNAIDNDGKEWFPDWTNSNEYKYTPWFNMNDSSSSSGLSFDGCDVWYSSCVYRFAPLL